MKKKVLLFPVLLLVVVSVSVFGCSHNKRVKEVISYEYQAIPPSYRILEIEKFEEYNSVIEPFVAPDTISEGSPDWGIKIFLTDTGYLYFYASHSQEINLAEEGYSKDSIIINEKELKLYESQEQVIGQYTLYPSYGILLILDKEDYTNLRTDIIEMIKTAEVYVKYDNTDRFEYDRYK